MTGPEGNSEFCFPRIAMFPGTKSRETLTSPQIHLRIVHFPFHAERPPAKIHQSLPQTQPALNNIPDARHISIKDCALNHLL